MIDRDFDKMRAEMDRIERWIARRSDSKALAWLPKARPQISGRRLAVMAALWAILFVVLPAWFMGAF